MYDTYPPPSRPIGRSIYGMLAPFPIACFVLAFGSDLAYWDTASYLWATFSVWLLALGLMVAGLAVLGGIVDLIRSRSVRGLAPSVPLVICEIVAVLLALVNVFIHSRDGYTAVVPQGLILSALTVLVLLVGLLVGRPTSARLGRIP